MTTDEGWIVQYSWKIGQDMLNLRADALEEFETRLDKIIEMAPKILSAAKTFQPQANFPIGDARATPPPAPTPTPAAPSAPPAADSPETVTMVRSVTPRQGRVKPDGKPGQVFFELAFADGSKATTFNTDVFTMAQTALAQNRQVAVVFRRKGDFLNIDNLRLLGPA